MAKLTIILGAGASHSINTDQKPLDRQGYRPPLTSDIFQGRGEYGPILNKYPLVQVIASEIEWRLGQEGLEQVLRTFEEQLAKGEATPVTRQFLQIPLYLNDLFGEVSTHFTTQPDEYNILVNHVLTKMDEALFLTLNYDTLLEKPLSVIFGIDFSDEAHYINKDWTLAKLHGSTNWYRRFTSVPIEGAGDQEYLQMLRTQPIPLDLENKFTLVEIPGHQKIFIDNIPVYPAITVPVDGKYQINCPNSILEKTKNFLAGCSNYLIVGTSGQDQDLLDILKNHARGGKVLIVGRDEESTNKTRKRFISSVPQFGNNNNIYFHERGFSEFIKSYELDEFLDQIV